MASIWNIVLITSLYGTIVGIITILIRAILKNRLSPQWQYIIWIILILKLIIPFGPESSMSMFNIIPQVPQQSTLENNYVVDDEVNPREPIINEIQNNLDQQEETIVKKSAVSWKALIPYVWVITMICMMLWMIYTYSLLSRKISKSKYNLNGSIVRIFEECKILMGVRRNIPLLIQDVVDTPALFGLIKPRILLTSAVLKLREEEIKYILLHELAHYRRKDLLVNFLLIILQSIHWFNPMIWYCFRLVRQDMEVATDEMVLSKIEVIEHKAYARTLITILEGITKLNFAPRVLSMAGDKKIIERRVKMIKKSKFFKDKKKIAIALVVICLIVLGGISLTNRMSSREIPLLLGYNEEELFKYKSKYIGDASNIINLLSQLEFGSLRQEVSLHTSNEPYGVTVNYDLTNIIMGADEIELALYNNALVMFVLIENLDNIYFKATNDIGEQKYEFSRNEVQRSFSNSLLEYSKDIESFKEFLETEVTVGVKKAEQIEKAVSDAIKERYQTSSGECITEGHIILGIEEENNTLKVYTIASVAGFGFENGIFTISSGSGAIPTVMIFSINKNGVYSLIEYEEPMDGEGNADSKKKMFPKKLHNKVLHADEEYSLLAEQQKSQAIEYLKTIGRETEVSIDYVERKLLNIDQDASNKLFAGEKTDYFINGFPYWAGTIERIEDGVRYIYETSQGKTEGGYDLVTFKKTKEDGTIVEERQYIIDGSEPKIIN